MEMWVENGKIVVCRGGGLRKCVLERVQSNRDDNFKVKSSALFAKESWKEKDFLHRGYWLAAQSKWKCKAEAVKCIKMLF